MTNENKDSTPAEPVEVAPDPTKDAALVEFDPVEEQTEPNGGGR